MMQGTQTSVRVTTGPSCTSARGAGACARLRPYTRSVRADTRAGAQPAGSVATAPAGDGPAALTSGGGGGDREADVVVIGSGIGGLCCGALAAKYGMQVTVCESHSIPGGAAHAWVQDGYHFEAGPSLYSGMAGVGKSANPLAHVLQAIGEPLDLIKYDKWNVLVPEGEFLTQVGNKQFGEVLMQVRGPEAAAEWDRLQEHMRPLARASTLLPPVAFRSDPGVALTAVARYLPSLLTGGPGALKLAGPFSKVIDGVVTDSFIRNWLDLLCFLLSGLPADGTIAAEVAFMFEEWYRPNCALEFPRGGSQAMVSALARGVTKRGGRLLLNAHVDQILIEGGRAAGVRLRDGRTIRARKAVVCNASVWDLPNMLPPGGDWAPKFTDKAASIPHCPSFMHLHLGIDAAGLPPDLEMHHIVVNDWDLPGGVTAPHNVVLISLASVADPSLAPPGKHVLHAYYPATEPYELWQGLERGSPEYEALKEERSQALWRAVERIIPDVRRRAEVTMVGTPLTHERFLRRSRGSYGPAIRAGEGLFPGGTTPIPGLLACGDSTFPGIGLPAVAASGAIAANSLASVWDHWRMLDALGV